MTAPYEFQSDLTAEDRARWMLHSAKMNAIRMLPALWNRQEIQDACFAELQFHQEFAERYGPDDTKNWIITRSTGRILYDVKD